MVLQIFNSYSAFVAAQDDIEPKRSQESLLDLNAAFNDSGVDGGDYNYNNYYNYYQVPDYSEPIGRGKGKGKKNKKKNFEPTTTTAWAPTTDFQTTTGYQATTGYQTTTGYQATTGFPTTSGNFSELCLTFIKS